LRPTWRWPYGSTRIEVRAAAQAKRAHARRYTSYRRALTPEFC
jgi:hypothetical protein